MIPDNGAILCCALLGFLALALAMSRHAKQVLGGALPAPRRRALRAGGWLLLVFALALCIRRPHWDVGLVAWLGWLSVAGVAVAFSLPYWPSRSGRS
ncbi:DUF3325 domain-containing protein [Parahaliea mediterranea]|uniref:DUF3325 domain-containing protein n=1 Tax=Parahaliea mediterranea TaxID=651086 RepID=A0A939DEP8_9GAMM|nr:DUF3325 domain-containing protein [Parahaliea mediterranea]MBN7796122.1 DUF3325 domain-containing protein [Parahaliea mediterranea]